MPVEFAASKNVVLAQKIGEELFKLNYETVAGQVKFADGADLSTKFTALSNAVSGQTGTFVVADIAARDAIANPKVGDQAWVIDASADEAVNKGGAKYLYESAETGWIKTAELEGLDVIQDWADIQNKPNSTVSQIDTAVIDAATNKADLVTVKADVATNKDDIATLKTAVAAKADQTELETLQTKVETLETGATKKSVMYAATLPDAVPEDLAEGGLLVIG